MAARQTTASTRGLARRGAIVLIHAMKREWPDILTDVQREEQIARAAHARAAKTARPRG
jgi:hypothetical protein